MITLTSSNRKIAFTKNKNFSQISDIIFNLNLKKKKQKQLSLG